MLIQSANPAKDWPEDAHLENGSYYCRCCVCGSEFIGYKRRVACKECAEHQHVKDHNGPSVPLRYGSAKSEVCACGAWRLVTHFDEPRGDWRTDSLDEHIAELSDED